MEETLANQSAVIRSSGELGELFAALSAAQGEITDPPKDKIAKVPMKTGGSYSYKYSDLADLLKISRPILAKHGLCLVQFPVSLSRGGVTIVTRLGHAKSGQYIEGDLTLALGDDKPQTLGASITYGRRYSAGAALGMSPDEDEDANVAQAAAPDVAKDGWKSKPSGNAASGAQAAAAAALAAGNPKPKKYNHALGSDRAVLLALVDKRKIDHSHLDEIGQALDGRPWSDLEVVLTLHRL